MEAFHPAFAVDMHCVCVCVCVYATSDNSQVPKYLGAGIDDLELLPQVYFDSRGAITGDDGRHLIQTEMLPSGASGFDVFRVVARGCRWGHVESIFIKSELSGGDPADGA